MGSDGEAMRVIAVVTARWNSTRLPGKMLADINGKALIQWVVDRCKMSKVDEVVVATTSTSKPIIDYCFAHDISFDVGPEEDIVSRLYYTALDYKADTIIRVWGDSPCVDPEIIDELMLLHSDYWYLDNGHKGTGAARLSFAKLERDYKTVIGIDRQWYHKYCWPDYSVDDEESLARVRSILV